MLYEMNYMIVTPLRDLILKKRIVFFGIAPISGVYVIRAMPYVKIVGI